MTGKKNPKEKNFEVNRRGPEFAGAFEPVAGNSAYGGLKWAKVVKLVPFFASIGAGFIMYTAGEEMKSRDLVMPTPSPTPRIVQTYTPPSTPPAPPAEPPVEPPAEVTLTPTPTPSPTPSPAPPPNLPAAPQDPEESPTPTPEESPEPTPTPTPTPAQPSFTSTKFEDRGDGVVEVSYTIQVDSVDGQDGQAVLMVLDKETGEFRQADGDEATRDYTGDWTGDWTVPNDTEPDGLRTEIPYEDGHYGSINRMKVRFNYTNADGESDYIDSTEIAVCSGTFVSFDKSELGGSGFSVSFKIDTDILDDPSAVTCSSATVEINGTERQLSASISDGVLTVGGLFDEILADGETIESMGPVKVTVNYNDGVADWTIETEGEVDRSPEIYVEQALVGSKLNGPGGLRSTLIKFFVADNGAEISSYQIKLGWEDSSGEHYWTHDGEYAGDAVDGMITVNDSIVLDGDDGYLYYPSSGLATAQVTVWYSLDGEEWFEKTEPIENIQQCDCYLEGTITGMFDIDASMEVIEGTITLKSLDGDPCSYTATLSDTASITWMVSDPEATPTTTTLSGDHFSLGKDILTVGESTSFRAEDWPPSGANGKFELYIDATAAGTMGDKDYDYVGGLQALITEESLSVFGGGYFSYSPDTYFGGSIALQGGVSPDDLTDLSFTFYKDGSPTSEISADGNIFSVSDDDGNWVGFEFIGSDGDTVPTLDLSATYQVYASAVYDGETVESQLFDIEMPHIPTVSIDHVYTWVTEEEPGGLQRAEVAFSVEPNDAAIIETTVTIDTGSESESWTDTGTGSVTLNVALPETFYYVSDGWTTTVTTRYTDYGVEGEPVSASTTSVTRYYPTLDVTIDQVYIEEGAVIRGTLSLQSNSDPTYSYSAGLEEDGDYEATLFWLPENPDNTPTTCYLEFDDEPSSITEGTPVTFRTYTSPPASDITGFRLAIDLLSVTCTDDDDSPYDYDGRVGNAAEGNFPAPTTLTVTVDGGKGLVKDGMLSADGSFTIDFDSEAGYASAAMRTWYLNWYREGESSYFDYATLDSSQFSATLTSSGTGQYVYSYNIGGVEVPTDAAAFTVEIQAAMLDSEDEECSWPSGVSDVADILPQTIFGDLHFSYDCYDEVELEGYVDLLDPYTTDDLGEGAYFTIFVGDAETGTVYSAADYDPGVNKIYLYDEGFNPIRPNEYFIQATATYRGHEFKSERQKIDVTYPALSDSYAEFGEDSSPSDWYDMEYNILYFSVTVDANVYIDPEYFPGATASLTNVKLVWSTGEETLISSESISGPTGADGDFWFTISVSDVPAPNIEVESVKLTSDAYLVCGEENETITVGGSVIHIFE